MQSIKIKNLGPISDFEMDLKSFNLLIGAQATGKSTISKGIYYFHVIKELIIEHLYMYCTDVDYANRFRFPAALNRRAKSLFIDFFGYSWNLDKSLNMEYCFTNDVYLSVCLNCGEDQKQYISIQYSEMLTNEVKKIERSLKVEKSNFYDFDFSFASNERARIREEIMRKINALFDDSFECFYIPAGRQLLTLMGAQKTKLDYDSIDYVNRRFMQFNESIQSRFENGILEAYKAYPLAGRKFDVKRVAKDIMRGLRGDYRRNNQREYLVLENHKTVPINYASSGQQEALWLYIQLYIFMLRGRDTFVIIEEPEAHLYPSLQRRIVEFITQFVNMENNQVIVTTHSPYILTTANLLYYSGKLGAKYPEQVSKILNKEKWISPEKFSAWKLSSVDEKTNVENLVDSDLQELKTSMIDEVSDEINELYSELFYCEVNDENT